MKAKKTNKKALYILAGLLIFEFVLLTLFFYRTQEKVKRAFLIKNGKSYIIAWQNDEKINQKIEVETLKEALEYASSYLKLFPTRQNIFELEHSWLADRDGKFVLFWKNAGYPFLHHLTFDTEKEAKFYFEAYRNGIYMPSPYGHSLLLLPQAE